MTIVQLCNAIIAAGTCIIGHVTVTSKGPTVACVYFFSQGVFKELFGLHETTTVPFLPSLLFPSPPFPSHSCLFPSYLPLKSTPPLNPTWGSGERCKRESNLVHFSRKNWHTLWVKKDQQYFSFITLLNIGRFSKFFHLWIQRKLCNKTLVTYSHNTLTI